MGVLGVNPITMVRSTARAPVEDVRVDVVERANGFVPHHRSAVTRGDGSYIVGPLPAGAYVVRAQPPAGIRQRADERLVIVAPGERVSRVNLTVPVFLAR
jgi:hypothetical protein